MIVTAVLVALFLDVPFLRLSSVPFLKVAPTAGTTDDVLNFADVVITDLTQEEKYNGKLEAVRGAGTIIPAAQISLAFDTSGTVADVLAQMGQDVQVGDVLACLDTTDLERAVTQAEIGLRQVQIALEVVQQPPTEARIQAAQDAVDQSAAALQLSQINKDATLNNPLLTQALPDPQTNYKARLSDYNAWLENYNNGKTTYW